LHTGQINDDDDDDLCLCKGKRTPKEDVLRILRVILLTQINATVH